MYNKLYNNDDTSGRIPLWMKNVVMMVYIFRVPTARHNSNRIPALSITKKRKKEKTDRPKHRHPLLLEP